MRGGGLLERGRSRGRLRNRDLRSGGLGRWFLVVRFGAGIAIVVVSDHRLVSWLWRIVAGIGPVALERKKTVLLVPKRISNIVTTRGLWAAYL